MTLGLALAVLAVPCASLGATLPAAATTSVGATAVELQQERASQAEVVKAALEARARRLARERHEAWVAKQLAKRAAADAALIASNRAKYGATPGLGRHGKLRVARPVGHQHRQRVLGGGSSSRTARGSGTAVPRSTGPARFPSRRPSRSWSPSACWPARAPRLAGLLPLEVVRRVR